MAYVQTTRPLGHNPLGGLASWWKTKMIAVSIAMKEMGSRGLVLKNGDFVPLQHGFGFHGKHLVVNKGDEKGTVRTISVDRVDRVEDRTDWGYC
jgi:hypothetical protein